MLLSLILILQSVKAGGGPSVAEMVRGLDWGRTAALIVLNLLMVFVGCFAGTFIGMLPGPARSRRSRR